MMNFNCSEDLLNFVYDEMVRYKKYFRPKKWPYLLAGCECQQLRIRCVTSNGAPGEYCNFLESKFASKLGVSGKVIGTVNGSKAFYSNSRQHYVIGRCAEQRACRDVFRDIEEFTLCENDLERYFNDLRFTKAYNVRIFLSEHDSTKPACDNCLTIFE